MSALTAYLQRIGAERVTFRRAVVLQDTDGYPGTKATVKFAPDGTVEAPEPYAPTPAEQEAIRAEVARHPFPTSIPADSMQRLAVQLGVHPSHPSLFKFYERTGKSVLLVRQRIERPDGKKACLPWTFWSDGEWRRMEPDGLLPLFGLEELSKYSRFLIHEGEKAARFCQLMRDGATDQARAAFDALPPSWQSAIKHAGHLVGAQALQIHCGPIGRRFEPHGMQRCNWCVIETKWGKMRLHEYQRRFSARLL